MLRALASLLGLGQRRCPNCLAPFTPQNPADMLCRDCRPYFGRHGGGVCPGCGEPGSSHLCPACQEGRPWRSFAFHGLYEGHLRDLILRLKYDGELSLAPFLASLLLEASACLPEPDVIVPIPQYPPHLRKRGFNQAHELCRHLARASGFKLARHLLVRVRHNRAQASLNRRERKENIKDNFAAHPDAAGKSIWLVDDVLTTGSTFEAAGNALLKAGCASLAILFVARTPPP